MPFPGKLLALWRCAYFFITGLNQGGIKLTGVTQFKGKIISWLTIIALVFTLAPGWALASVSYDRGGLTGEPNSSQIDGPGGSTMVFEPNLETLSLFTEVIVKRCF